MARSPGPFDLAKQMNIQRGSEEHEAAIQRTLKAAHSSGKKAAIFCKSLSGALYVVFDCEDYSFGTAMNYGCETHTNLQARTERTPTIAGIKVSI